jgi:hypothetical protein
MDISNNTATIAHITLEITSCYAFFSHILQSVVDLYKNPPGVDLLAYQVQNNQGKNSNHQTSFTDLLILACKTCLT